mgnify:FL=1|tara:strand:- start:452 stop:1069 length:618 start_codon:yes stop_codon:yes gene_type:complete
MLSEDIPHFPVYVRSEFLYDFQEGSEGFLEGVCHGVTAIPGRALGFHVLLNNGAHIGRLPIHALSHVEGAARREVWQLQLWDCFSAQLSVHEFGWLSGMRVRAYLPGGEVEGGEYMFTVDYWGNNNSENAGETGWKCHHVIQLDNGLFAAQPNNRLCFFEPSVVVPFDEAPRYKTMTRTWKCEDGAKWRCSDDDRMFYTVEEAGE